MQSNVAVADTADQQALADAVTKLLERHWPAGEAHKQVSDPDSVSEVTLWTQLSGLGIAGLPVAEAAGGAGGRWADLAVALEALGGALAPTPAVAVAGAIGTLTALADTARADTALADEASDGPAAELLAQVCAGDVVATVAWTQRPGLWGSNGAFRTEPGQSGQPSPAHATGPGLRVSGTASLVLSPEAGRVLLLADSPASTDSPANTDSPTSTDAPGTPLLLLVDPNAEGATMRRIGGLDLLRPLGALTLDDVPATVLASGDAALAAARHGLVTAAAALASELVGAAGHCLDAAVAYAAERRQFGKPIGSFQAVKHICANMLAGVELARAAARNLAGLLDAGADPADLDDAVALALLKVTSVAQQAAADYIQILGGIGYSWEHEAHLYYRRAGAAAPLFGTAATHRRQLDPTARFGAATTATATTIRYGIAPGTPAAELAAHVERLLPAHKQKWGGNNSFPARLDWQRTLHAAGWIAPQWPAEFGGRALGIVDQVACDRVLDLYRTPELAGVLGVNNVAPTLMRYGTPEQQAHLRGIQAGTEVWCQGFSEPGSGSDLASLRTRAVLDEAAGEFVINGEKIWTSEGMEADYCMLLVRTDPDAPPHKGISALLVPLDTPGITRRPITQITGEGGFAQVFCDDVRVPRSALLGPLNEGWTVTMTTLGFERAGVIMMAGRIEQAVRDVVSALDGRELDPETRIELTERLAEGRLLGLLGQRALGRIAAGGAPGAEHSVIKLAWSLGTQAVGSTHLAALGLDGIIGSSTTAQQDYLRSRAATIAGGTTEIMRNILAERVLGMPR